MNTRDPVNTRRLTARDYKGHSHTPLRFDRWREFGIGLGAGLLVAAIVYISDHRTINAQSEELRSIERPADTGKPPADASAAPVATPSTSAAVDPTQDYKFYDMLRNYEVVVPEKGAAKKPGSTTGPITQPGTYFVQAGAFKAQPDADRVRAQLDKQGITATVQRVAIDNDVRFRVRIGPINDLAKLNRIRSQLQASDFNSIPIRVSD